MKIELKTRLSADSAADEHDVRQLKKALNILGYYTPYEQTGITGTPDARLFSALKKFQKDSNLPASGIIKPDDPTLDTLNDALTDTPQGYYIWRTAGDERVRPEHAQYNGTKRAWSDSPDPGEDFNCRCWAEPVEIENEIYDPPIRRVYPELFLIPALKAKNILNLLELSATHIISKTHPPKIRMDNVKTWPKPPKSGKFREGPPSRQKPRMRGEKSLYDDKGGEWRYAGEDKYHNPHWDYKESPSSSWKNISIDDKPILKSGR